ncbi:MAG: 8-oxo-dGTP diphosphatase MutT [Sorangium cellulosum]|nr:MAG: 8-oxo-dGTP diphosphatase MutT [Sorangium cellulosum]
MKAEPSTLLVVAAVIISKDRVLVTQRPAHSHLAGMWEFPGGKVESNEDPRHALARELKEELGVSAEVHEVVEVTFHRYPKKNVLLIFFQANLTSSSSAPEPLDVADFAWRRADELLDKDFPPADVSILSRVRTMLSQGS